MRECAALCTMMVATAPTIRGQAMDQVQKELVRRQAMEIRPDLRAFISSSSELPKIMSANLIKSRTAAAPLGMVDAEDADAEMCAALAVKDELEGEVQILVDELTALEWQAVEETDAGKKARRLVQCRIAANDLKVRTYSYFTMRWLLFHRPKS